MKTSFLWNLAPALFAGLASLVRVPDTHARVFVATNSTWRYFKGASEASNPTNAWRELDCADSAWLVGAAPFHYGTNAVGGDDELTGGTLLDDMRSNYTCVFVRHRFVLADTNHVAGLWLNAWFDDGLAIWINGRAARNPLYVSGLAYTNTATSSREGSARSAINLSNAIGLLRPGTNVLCLQAFNRSLTDDDFRIDVELAETPPMFALDTNSYTLREDAGEVMLRVVRTGGLDGGVTVDYVTTNGTAVAGSDYEAVAGTLTFAAGETSRGFTVPILNDGLVEPAPESFQVLLRNPTNAILGSPMMADVQILDNDKGLHFYMRSVSVDEDEGAVSVKIARGDDGDTRVSVDYATASGTAIAGQDYTSSAGTITFDPGELLKSCIVPIPNDAFPEPSKAFAVTLSNPTGGAILSAPAVATVTITDMDQVVQFDSLNYSVREEAEFVQIGIMRGESDSAATVDLTTSDATATAGLDYIGLTNTIQFRAHERLKWINISMLNDRLREIPETFRVVLSHPTGDAVLGTRLSSTVTITDNDPGLGFATSACSVPQGAEVVNVAVVRGSDEVLAPVTVDFQTADGSAQAGLDYESVSGALAFQANEALQSIPIPILQNEATTGPKSFTVTLNNPSTGAALGIRTTQVSILHPGGYYSVSPALDAKPRLRHVEGVNILTWEGDGLLQHAERVTGPWEDLPGAASPYATLPGTAMGFYRVQSTRTTEVYVPSRYDAWTALPLLLALHPYGFGASFMSGYFNLQPLAESRGFFLCYPNGTVDAAGSAFWNGPDFTDFYGSTVDDSGYLRAVIEEISRRFAVDRNQIYVTGYSSGGAMAHRLACEHADLIAGIASLAGQTYYDRDNCRPSQPVNVLHIQGTADEYSPYAGGPMGGGLPVVGELPGAVRTVQIWGHFNACQEPLDEAAPSLNLIENVLGFDTTVLRYTRCPPGGSVELWTINGGTHYPTLSSEFLPRLVDWLLGHPKP